MENHYDIIILGGGIAAMTAAIYTSQANMKTMILEKSICGGLVNTTYKITNFPSHQEVSGQDLMEKVRDQVSALGVDIREVIEVDRLSLQGDRKSVKTDEGIFYAPAVILATGRKPRELPLDVDCDQIHYCAICDGSGYKGKKILVVGGGNSGVEESQYLLSLGVAHITVIEQMDQLFASKQAQNDLLRHGGKVDVLVSTTIEELEILDNKLTAAVLKNTQTKETEKIPVDGIFVYMGHETQTELFKNDVDLNAKGYIEASAHMETSIPGVFAAGDIIWKPYWQITTAMNDGTIAALRAAEYIRKTQDKRERASSTKKTEVPLKRNYSNVRRKYCFHENVISDR